MSMDVDSSITELQEALAGLGCVEKTIAVIAKRGLSKEQEMVYRVLVSDLVRVGAMLTGFFIAMVSSEAKEHETIN